MTKASEAELTVWQRSFAAGTSSGICAVLCNPLEVVKTRMQSDLAHPGKGSPVRHLHRPVITGSVTVPYSPGGATLSMPLDASSPILLNRNTDSRSIFGTLGKIARTEGAAALWRGTEASLLITVPLIALYLPLYDTLLEGLQGAGTGMYAPLLAGSGARAVACLATAPLELLKTRLQSQPQEARTRGPAAQVYRQHVATQIGQLRGDMQGGGVLSPLRTLWKGVGATLAKDIPFAALFWMLLEPMRQNLQPGGMLPLQRLWLPASEETGRLSSIEAAVVNAVAGSVAGGIAAGITTPFDVIKTQLQTIKNLGQTQTMWSSATRIVRRRGMPGLFLGVKPRAMRVALSYSILMSSYELFKTMYAQHEHVPPEVVTTPTPAPQDSAPAGAPSL